MVPNLDKSLVSSKYAGVQQLLKEPTFAHFDNYFAIKTFAEYINCQIMDIPKDMDPLR